MAEGKSSKRKKLPQDLVTEILLKLPVKTLVRLKVVCKRWKLLINSTIFIDNHLRRKDPLHAYDTFLVNRYEGDDNPFPFEIIYTVGEGNGILCFETTNPKNPLVLFNPSTREFSFLPKECSGDFYGFCYISQTQEYKVICFKWLLSKDNAVSMRILTLGSKEKSFGDVKKINLPGRISSHCVRDATQVTCGSTIVWLGEDNERTDIVIFYDAFEDKFSTLNVPPPPLVVHPYEEEEEDTVKRLGVDKKSVFMFVFKSCDYTFLDIWKLCIDDEPNDKSWMKYRKIEASETCPIINPIYVCPDGRILCSKDNDEYRDDKLFYYDLETDQVEDYKTKNPQVVILEFVNYVESLVSPKYLCSIY